MQCKCNYCNFVQVQHNDAINKYMHAGTQFIWAARPIVLEESAQHAQVVKSFVTETGNSKLRKYISYDVNARRTPDALVARAALRTQWLWGDLNFQIVLNWR